MSRHARLLISLLILLTVGTTAVAQRGFGRRQRNFDPATVDRNGVPVWDNNPHFKSDVFTFCRVRYSSRGGWGSKWATDYPDSDFNFSEISVVVFRESPALLRRTRDIWAAETPDSLAKALKV